MWRILSLISCLVAPILISGCQWSTNWSNYVELLALVRHKHVRIINDYLLKLNLEGAYPMYSETTPVKRQKTSSAENPRHFFLHMLLKHPEGLWDRAESTENSIQWERCTEYFDFLYQLLCYLQGTISVTSSPGSTLKS